MLTLSAQVWHKLAFLAKNYTHEVSGFGVSSVEKPFYVKEFHMVEQINDASSTEMTEEGLANYMDTQLAREKAPCEFMRIWCHTHPVGVNSPSKTDNDTMVDVFEECDWAIMFIITKELKTYAEIQTKALSETIHTLMDVEVDWKSYGSTNPDDWEQEHDECHSPFVYSKPALQFNKAGKTQEFHAGEASYQSLFWENDILDWLLDHKKISQKAYAKMSQNVLANKELPTAIVALYKEAAHDPYLSIAAGSGMGGMY